MGNLYTSKILTSDLYSYHDVSDLPSLKEWAVESVNSLINPNTQASPEYPFYYKKPLPTFFNMQYGFAPYTEVSFFAYGTDFVNTTGHYEIYDEYCDSPVQVFRKYIPTLVEQSPIQEIPLTTIDNIQKFGGQWYICVSYHPANINLIATSSIILNTVVVNNQLKYSIFELDTVNKIKGIQITPEYSTTTNTLRIVAKVFFDVIKPGSYNFVVNAIKLPYTENVYTTSYFVCSFSSTGTTPNFGKLYDIPASKATGGKILALASSETDGSLVENRFCKDYNNNIAQEINRTYTPNAPKNIDIFITTSNQISCIIPASGTWTVSGIFLDHLGTYSNTPFISFAETLTDQVTLLDTITSYNAATKTLYGADINQGGSVCTKYELIIRGQDYSDNRTVYLNWYRPQLNQVTYKTTSSLISSNFFNICAIPRTSDYNSPIDVYAIIPPTTTWEVSGYKTDLTFTELSGELTTQSNVLSSSWTGFLQATGIPLKDITAYIIDKIPYIADPLDFSKTNQGGEWDVLLVLPGSELIIKKQILATWSALDLGSLNYTDNTEIILDNNNFYQTLSGAFNIFAYYDIFETNSISIGVRTSIPLEIYACRKLYSSPNAHLQNYTLGVPITGKILSGTSTLLDSYNKNTITRSGAKYSLLAYVPDTNKNSIYTHKQLTTLNTITGITTVENNLLLPNDIIIYSTLTPSTINVYASSSDTDYNVAGYKVYNNSTTLVPLFSSEIISFTKTFTVSSFDLDSISYNDGYDITWYITYTDNNQTASKIQELTVAYNFNKDIKQSSKFYNSSITNSNILSSIASYARAENSSIVLTVTGKTNEINDVNGILATGYRKGSSNFCIGEELPYIIPANESAEINYTFTYPGTYSVAVSALTGNNVVTKTLTSNLENYFKVLDIPPLVNFDITTFAPTICDYTPKHDPENNKLSYYKNNLTISSLTALNVYINTWTLAPGSFGIDSIWIDYGDGSEIEKINKLRNTSSDYRETAFPAVKNDPRNYVFAHTYGISSLFSQSFTVTITAFSENTNTYSTGFKLITGVAGILPTKKYLLNSGIFSDNSILYNVQINTEKLYNLNEPATITNIQYFDSRLYKVLT